MAKIQWLIETDGKKCWNCKHFGTHGICKKWCIPVRTRPCSKYKKDKKSY